MDKMEIENRLKETFYGIMDKDYKWRRLGSIVICDNDEFMRLYNLSLRPLVEQGMTQKIDVVIIEEVKEFMAAHINRLPGCDTGNQKDMRCYNSYHRLMKLLAEYEHSVTSTPSLNEDKLRKINLEAINKKVDELLENETPESLLNWLNSKRLNSNSGEQEAVEFVEWVEARYKAVYSLLPERWAWVNTIEHDILIHGSEDFYRALIEKHGKTTTELYQLFKTNKAK